MGMHPVCIHSYILKVLMILLKLTWYIMYWVTLPVWLLQWNLSTKNTVFLKNDGSLFNAYWWRLQALSYTTTSGANNFNHENNYRLIWFLPDSKRSYRTLKGIRGDSEDSITSNPQQTPEIIMYCEIIYTNHDEWTLQVEVMGVERSA